MLYHHQIDIELSWTANSDVNQYVVEFFKDSLQFIGDPVSTTTIEDIPATGTITYTESFAGDTRYSARVKAIVDGQPESKWAPVTARTSSEQIFLGSSII